LAIRGRVERGEEMSEEAWRIEIGRTRDLEDYPERLEGEGGHMLDGMGWGRRDEGVVHCGTLDEGRCV
jgi:hypothetical protein